MNRHLSVTTLAIALLSGLRRPWRTNTALLSRQSQVEQPPAD